MGYPVEQFVNQDIIKDEFKCPICHDVLQDPIEVKYCEHAFCTQCYDEWKKKSDACPVCRRKIRDTKKPQRLFLNLLNGLKMVCQFKEGRGGCTKIVELGGMEDHEERCQYNPENLKECGGGCGIMLAKHSVQDHNCVTYLSGRVRARERVLQGRLETKDREVKRLKDHLQSKDKEMNFLKDQLDTYRRVHGPLGRLGPLDAKQKAVTPSAQSTASTPNRISSSVTHTPSACAKAGEPYEMTHVQKKRVEHIVNTHIAQRFSASKADRDHQSLEERIEAILNQLYTQEIKYGSNTFWRVGLINPAAYGKEMLQTSLPPCPCHRGKDERISQHYGGTCLGEGGYKVLSTYNFIGEKDVRVGVCHYLSLR